MRKKTVVLSTVIDWQSCSEGSSTCRYHHQDNDLLSLNLTHNVKHTTESFVMDLHQRQANPWCWHQTFIVAKEEKLHHWQLRHYYMYLQCVQV